MNELSAYLAVSILILLSIFQLLLILGKPLGRFAWGGQHDVLPLKFRISSVSSIALYMIFIVIILEAADILNVAVNTTFSDLGIKILTGYFLIGIFMNLASRSKSERNLMTPVAFLLFITCLIVAL